VAGPTPNTLIQRARAVRRNCALMCMVVLAFSVTMSGCVIEIEAPPETGFLAVILTADGAQQVIPGRHYSLRIQELSGTYPINDRFEVSPNDTVIRTYPLATYALYVDSVPPACTSRFGFAQQALISTAGNTTIARFNFICNSLLGITIAADGNQVDSSYVWTVTGPAGFRQFGLADAADTIRINDITAGDYTVELGHIAENCIPISDGWRRQTLKIVPPISGSVYFRVKCFDPERTPRVIHFASSFRNGVAGFYAEVVDTDPDDAIAGYGWNITDCLGNPLYPNSNFIEERLRYDRTAGQDTARIVVIRPLPDPNDDLAGACTAVRFEDLQGNTTAWIEERNRNETGQPPVIHFNAVRVGNEIAMTLTASDPDNDLAGAFVSASFRDGSLFTPPNGRPDILIRNLAGYLPPFLLPSFPASSERYSAEDLLSVIVDVMDRAGNITRAVDTNFSQ
jgi:hypothetical protein